MASIRILPLVWLATTVLLTANPVITEIMADNETTIADEDGAFSDWIELHNPTADPLSLENWCLTDKSSNLTLWRFPAVTLAPGEFIVVFASNKNRRIPGATLHTNFALSKDGEYLALVRPDGITVQQSFAPKFPSQRGDESYGFRFHSTKLIAQGAPGRYTVPTSASTPAADWVQPAFADGTWSSGTSGFGFGITTPGISVKQVSKNGSIGGLNDALTLLSLPTTDSRVLSSTTKVMDVVNLLGDGGDGHYAFNSLPPGNGGDHYAVSASGFITIPTAGVWTFGLNSDDGGRIVINSAEVMRDDSFHAPQDKFGSITLAAGMHSFEIVMFEAGGGDCVEFFAAPGTHTSFNSTVFRLVGDTANDGLAASTLPAGSGSVIGTNLATALTMANGAYFRLPFTSSGTANAMSLLMRQSDGFSAWLNGTAVASVNIASSPPAWNELATASQTNPQTLRRRTFNLTSSLPLLVQGSNTLAIHGMKSSASDDSFMILPELVMGSLNTSVSAAFYGDGLATPGWINGQTSSLGNVADTVFSIDRGFFTQPFPLSITSATPGAVIRYTTDGSTPSATNGTVYTGPLTISSTTVLRVIAMLEGWKSTGIDTQTYLFPEDVLTQAANGLPPSGWPNSSEAGRTMDYGMDPDIVNHTDPDIGGRAAVKASLLAIPSVSIVTDSSNLFNKDGSQGIYSNPGGRGFAWERPCSLEWLDPPDTANPNGSSEFQIDAGMRIRGGFSRSGDNPKHAFRFFFRSDYGPSELIYPLFGDSGAPWFDKIDLRTSQNYSWSFQGDDRNTFLREESSRQAQLDMGQPGSRVRYVHVYLNGQYWGLYDLDERPEAAFAESYFGGDEDEYDVVKTEQELGYVVGATDGTIDAWRELWDKGKVHRATPTNENYFRLMGLAADGVTPTADPVLLDVDNLIDYMLVTFWTGNFDGAVSAFLGNERANNWFASRRRENNPRQGFRFFVHDFEHSLFDVNEDRTGPFTSGNESVFEYSNPMFLHQDLLSNAEYRMRWADRVHRHLFNSGALTTVAWQNRINRLAAVVDTAIIAESARWGDSKRSTPFNKNDWERAQNQLVSYLPQRNAVVISQLKADGLYPSLDAPTVNPSGGYQPDGAMLSLQGPSGAMLHYMPDGSDPRAVGGGLKAGALTYSSNSVTETILAWSAGGWRYLADGSNQGTAWRDPVFNDSSWPSGTGELGYGDGDEATVIPQVDINPSLNGTQRAATCYFRKSFNVTNTGAILGATIRVEYDDAYAVYLNGVRVGGNLPVNPAYNYYTGTNIEDTIATVSVGAENLVYGTNVVAVEIHQAHQGSSDLSMNLSLTASRAVTPDPIILSGTGQRIFRARAKSGSTWSALTENAYRVGVVAPTASTLVVSEISYHPAAPHPDTEFVELLNTGTTALDLAGASFTDGIEFTFAADAVLQPGARTIVVGNLAAFQALYGTNRPVTGEFANGSGLSNLGERIRLEGVDGSVLIDFTYGTGFPWPSMADGFGRTMVLVDPALPADPRSWRPSASAFGNPGTSDSIIRPAGRSLIDHLLAERSPRFDRATSRISVRRRLGSDAIAFQPEWSADCVTWSPAPAVLVAETPDDYGNSTMEWELDNSPADQRLFFRVRVGQ
jgi:hypothetical protein